MDKQVFMMLVNDLEKIMKGSRNMSIVEMLAMFLYILGQGQSNRSTQERFQRSGETVSRYFDIMLEIFYNMAKVLINPRDPEFRSIPQEILTDSRYMPHFKDCIGAIDGVHVQASISPCDHVPYIGRKGIPTQNVLAICNFDMQFTFACAGWEGTAYDSRVFLTALRNPQSNFPKPPNGKYYVVDAGYPQMKGYLGPYKGERYHLPHFRRGDEPTGHKEIFNHAHSSLRGVIERTLGVWKKKWSILRDMPHFPYEKQVTIVIATMALHNYIRRYAQRDIDFDESGNYSSEETSEEMEDNEHDGDGSGREEMEVLRNAIAQSLMNAST
ncbi:protein ALP1-like [Rosa chinensis]|uniref:protein ALP1-like n=1 Tax=Rosa chinensis TaxID=74649 RepID=UPI001AD8F9AA|nr:protein ALP1-like [Rosa chinensis]